MIAMQSYMMFFAKVKELERAIIATFSVRSVLKTVAPFLSQPSSGLDRVKEYIIISLLQLTIKKLLFGWDNMPVTH